MSKPGLYRIENEGNEAGSHLGQRRFGHWIFWPETFRINTLPPKLFWLKWNFGQVYYKSDDVLAKSISAKIFFFDFLEKLDSYERNLKKNLASTSFSNKFGHMSLAAISLAEMSLAKMFLTQIFWPKTTVAKQSLCQLWNSRQSWFEVVQLIGQLFELFSTPTHPI